MVVIIYHMEGIKCLITFENITCVYFVKYIIKAGIISVCDDCLTFLFEFFEIIYYGGSKEGFAVF